MTESDLGLLAIDPSARERRRPSWLAPVVIGLALLAVATVVGWWLTTQRAVEVRVVEAKAWTAGPTAVLNASGYVTPRLRATVSAKVTGKVVEILVEEGLKVEAGQVLARLDATDAAAELAAAAAELDVAQARVAQLEVDLDDARRTLRRTTGLRQDGVASEEEFDSATAHVRSLEAGLTLAGQQVVAAERRVAVARQAVENHVVRAPFAGIVVSKDAQPGEMVSPMSAGGGFTRTGIATVVDMASLEIEVDVNESYIARVTPGQQVEAILDAYPSWRIPAHVITVIPTADRQKATVKVRIGFQALDPRILPDMGVRVSFLEERTAAAAAAPTAVVPRSAVVEEEGSSMVFVLREDRVERRTVGVGQARGDEVEIVAGLQGGELLVVHPPAGLGEGQRVKVVK